MPNEKPRYCFIDIDGVLTNFKDTPGSYITHQPDTYGLSPSNVLLLKKFCEQYNMKLVISSNWRKFPKDGFFLYDVKRYTNPIKSMYDQFGKIIVGTLTSERHLNKSEALVLWFEGNDLEESDVEYVVFDDDYNEMFQTTIECGIRNHVIFTDPQVGLTEDDLKKAKEKLNI